jgi:hypothetical protein
MTRINQWFRSAIYHIGAVLITLSIAAEALFMIAKELLSYVLKGLYWIFLWFVAPVLLLNLILERHDSLIMMFVRWVIAKVTS